MHDRLCFDHEFVYGLHRPSEGTNVANNIRCLSLALMPSASLNMPFLLATVLRRMNELNSRFMLLGLHPIEAIHDFPIGTNLFFRAGDTHVR